MSSDFFWSRKIRARKRHDCQECDRAIETGHEYERCGGRYEGDFFEFAICSRCSRLWDLWRKREGDMGDDGPCIGELRQAIGEGRVRDVLSACRSRWEAAETAAGTADAR